MEYIGQADNLIYTYRGGDMLKKKYIYKRTLYKLGEDTYKRVDDNKLFCEKDKDGFQISLTFSATREEHNKAIEDVNNILIQTLFK